MTAPYPSPIEIAVVIVTRNMLAGLKATLASLAASGDDRLRIYVVDGASRDGTVEHLRQFAPPNLQWQSEPDTGIYDAMNKGWKLPPEQAYILYLGAGDKVVSLPTNETLQRTRANGINIVIGSCLIGTMPFRSAWHAGLMLGNTAHHQALLVRKSLHPAPPFDATLRVYADWDFNLRLYMLGALAHFDETFNSYAEPGGVSATHNLSEVWRVSRRHGGLRVGIRAYRENLEGKMKALLRKHGLRRP